jgi:hypothetical protein
MDELLRRLELYFQFKVKSLSSFSDIIVINKVLYMLNSFPVSLQTELFIELGIRPDETMIEVYL